MMNRFRFPEGVEFLGGGSSDSVEFEVSIPLDDDGFLGRECPACHQHFRIEGDDYDVLPDEVRLHCVYCGHNEAHDEFLTAQQEARVMRAVGDYGEQLVGQMFDDMFGRMARRSRGSAIEIKYRSRPFFPSPLPEISEERLVRQRRCQTCDLRYAVFGEHRFCPVCGRLPAPASAADGLAAELLRLDLLGELDQEQQASLRESGVLDRTYVDTIENVVALVEALAERIFNENVPDANNVTKGKGKVFQRLNDFADLYVEHLSIDPRSALGPDWTGLVHIWAARHVFTHCDGIVDDKYINDTNSRLKVGQRLRVTEAEARNAISCARKLCHALSGEEPPATGPNYGPDEDSEPTDDPR